MNPGATPPRRWSLATRVLAAVLGLLAVLLVIVVLTHEQATGERRQAEIASAADSGTAVVGMIDEFARNLETSLLALSLGLADQPLSPERISPALTTVSKATGLDPPMFLFVTDVEGKVLASANGGSIGIDLSGRPYMRTLMDGAPTVWGPAVAGIQSGSLTLTYGRAIRTASGSLRGYLIAAFYPSSLAARFSDRIPPDANVTIIDRNGVALYSDEPAAIGANRRVLSDRPEVAAALEGTAVRFDNAPGFFDDAEHFGIVMPVTGIGWAVAFMRPLEPLDAALRRGLLTQAGVVTAAVVVVGALMIVATRRTAQPLRELAVAAGAVARGEPAALTFSGGGREVAELATSIQVMSDAVTAREQSLQREAERRQLLADTSAAFAEAGLDLQGELQTVARLVAARVGEGCNVFLVSKDGAWLEPAAIYHPAPELTTIMAEWLAAAPVPVGGSLAGRVARSGTPLILTDVLEGGRELVEASRLEHFRRIGMHAFAAVRIGARGRTVGVLAVWRNVAVPYSDEEVALLTEIADHAGVNIENAQLIEDVRANMEMAERAVQLREEFAAQVAHDILNPLSAIKAVAQSTLRQLDRRGSVDPERLRNDMRALDTAVTKAANEVSSQLDAARVQAGRAPAIEPSSVDLVELIEDAVEQARRLSTRHRVVLDVDQDFVVGEVDRERLTHAIDNILGNAVKYSPVGGTVTVTLRTEAREGRPWATIAMRDEGIGIPRAALPHIFDRFYRAENATQFAGTGLGLHGVQQIVEAHGGTVHVDSVEGQGSVFTLCLPLAASRDPAGVQEHAGPVGSARRTE